MTSFLMLVARLLTDVKGKRKREGMEKLAMDHLGIHLCQIQRKE